MRRSVHIVENEQGSRTTPSCVTFKDQGRPAVGGTFTYLTLPSQYVYAVKRLIGRRFSDACVQVCFDC